MFTSTAFDSWALIVFGALVFALLFGLATFMGDTLLVKSFVQPGRTALGLGLAAFAGYIGVALLIRFESRDV